MRIPLIFTLLLILPAAASAAPPSDAQLDRLLEVTRTEQQLEAMIPQIEQAQEEMALRLTGGASDTDRAVGSALANSRTALRRILTWERLRPMYLEVYRNTYESEDIEAITQFYQTPAGQRLLERQPEMVKNTMEAVERLIQPEFEQLASALAELEKAPASKKVRR